MYGSLEPTKDFYYKSFQIFNYTECVLKFEGNIIAAQNFAKK